MKICSWTEIRGSGVEREIAIVMQTFDMSVPDGEGTYLAAPISTGCRYYEELSRHGAKTYAELIDLIGVEGYLNKVRWPNVADGEQIATDLRRRGTPYVINTGPFMISGWEGKDYMDLCFTLIEKKVRRVYFHPDWAFSTGAVQELLFCYRLGLRCLRLDGQSITLDEARAKIAEVGRFLQTRSLSTEGVDRKLREVDMLAGASAIR